MAIPQFKTLFERVNEKNSIAAKVHRTSSPALPKKIVVNYNQVLLFPGFEFSLLNRKSNTCFFLCIVLICFAYF